MADIVIPKSARECVRVGWSEYRGRRLLGGRVFYLDQESGEWRPGRHGLNLPPELAVQVALAVLRQAGVHAPDGRGRPMMEAIADDDAGEGG